MGLVSDIFGAASNYGMYNGKRDNGAHQSTGSGAGTEMFNGKPDSGAHQSIGAGSGTEMFNGYKDENAHGSNSDTKGTEYYLGTPNNADRFSSRFNPVKQQFNGLVNFYFNPEISGLFTTADTRNGLSSLVKTATMPSFSLNTETRNQYNKKRVTVSGVEYKPIQVTVYDTVDSAWVTTIMRTYQHLFTNPTGKYTDNADGTTQPVSVRYDVVPQPVTTGDSGSFSGFTQPFHEDSPGYNIRPGNQRNIITHIDLLMYHAQKYTRFTVFNPIITGFEIDGLDYSSSQPVMITMDIEYENFSMDPLVNGYLPEDDMKRWVNFSAGNWELLRQGTGEGESTSPVDIGAGYPGGHRTGVRTIDMAALKPQKLDFLAAKKEGTEGSTRTEQSQDFWKNFNPG